MGIIKNNNPLWLKYSTKYTIPKDTIAYITARDTANVKLVHKKRLNTGNFVQNTANPGNPVGAKITKNN